MIKFAQNVQSQYTILPTGPVYQNGPGLSTLLGMLSDVTGVSIVPLQLLVFPFIAALIIFVAYLCFLELTQNKKVAILAAFLLSLQPDYLFTTSRGTHEKFTYSMVLLAIFFLSRSFSRGRKSREFGYYIILFYIAMLGMISYNFFFASTFVFAIILAFIIGYAISDMPQITASFKRMTYTSAVSIIFFFSYMFYLYPPARTLFYAFDKLADKIGVLALATEQHVTPQYTYIFQTWVSFKAWLLLTLFNWVIAPISLAGWIYFVHKFLRKKQRLSTSLLMLLMFYAAFSLQLLITIFADRFGVFNNLELRIFPVLMFFAVPLASISLVKIFEFQLTDLQRKAIKVGMLILILVFAASSLLKATNDPTVSNKWIFYSNQEKEGLYWIEKNLQGQIIFAGLDTRLIDTFDMHAELSSFGKTKFRSPDNAEYWMISETIIKRSIRLRLPLPDVTDRPVVYDSGGVKIYRNHA
jgi:hypothetical protein